VHDVVALLGPSGTASVSGLSSAVAPRTVSRWIATGRLVRLHPGWVTVPELAEDWTVRAHAATGYSGGPLSHMSALAVHGVVDTEVTRLNVTVSPTMPGPDLAMAAGAPQPQPVRRRQRARAPSYDDRTVPRGHVG
jgi:hypothetical protein